MAPDSMRVRMHLRLIHVEQLRHRRLREGTSLAQPAEGGLAAALPNGSRGTGWERPPRESLRPR